MNIFYTSHCPIESAKFLSHDRKRHNKMILESIQLLSTAIWKNGGNGPYKPNHENHPCTIWAAKSRGNFNWLFKHTNELFKLYQKKYGVVHKSGLLLHEIGKKSSLMPDFDQCIPPNCAANPKKGLDFKQLEIREAYRRYLYKQWDKEGIK